MEGEREVAREWQRGCYSLVLSQQRHSQAANELGGRGGDTSRDSLCCGKNKIKENISVSEYAYSPLTLCPRQHDPLVILSPKSVSSRAVLKIILYFLGPVQIDNVP